MMVGAVWFSVMGALVKALGQGIPSQQIVLVRAVINLGLSVWMIRRVGISPWGQRRGLLVLRGVFGFLALSCFFHALTRLPLAEANLIQLSSPIYTAILAALVLGERMGRVEIACVAASAAGVLLVVRPPGSTWAAGLPPTAVAIAVCGAVFSACAYVTIRRLTGENPLVVVFYFPLITVPASLPWIWDDLVWPTALEWLMLLGVGVTTQMAQVALTRGIQREPAGRATAVGFLQVVLAAAWGIAFFGEVPGPWSWVGAALIVASTVGLAVVARRAAPPVVRLGH